MHLSMPFGQHFIGVLFMYHVPKEQCYVLCVTQKMLIKVFRGVHMATFLSSFYADLMATVTPMIDIYNMMRS